MAGLTRFTLATLTAALLTGCANSDTPKMTTDAAGPTELAAYAASHEFPATRPSNDLRVAALVSPDRSVIKIYNFTNDPLADVDVWVNGSFAQHIRGLGANGNVVVKTSDLYNHFGKSFASQSEPVSRVQIKVGDSLYNTMGPITE
jgi:hypothetical protein